MNDLLSRYSRKELMNVVIPAACVIMVAALSLPIASDAIVRNRSLHCCQQRRSVLCIRYAVPHRNLHYKTDQSGSDLTGWNNREGEGQPGGRTSQSAAVCL